MPYQADGNQAAIKAALVAVGCSVALIEGANHSSGVPDMVIGRDGRNFLLEIKRPKVGKLSDAQAAWHRAWRGQVAVVKTVEEALAAVGIATGEPKPLPSFMCKMCASAPSRGLKRPVMCPGHAGGSWR